MTDATPLLTAGSPAPAPAHSPDPVAISKALGNAVAAAGFAFMIMGAVAVFTVRSDVGAAALLALGLVLFLVGVARQLPTSLKYRDAEVHMSARAAVQEFVTETVANATPEELPGVARRVEKLARSAPDIAAPAVSWAATEQSMLASVHKAISIGLPRAEVRSGPEAGSHFDLVVSQAGSGRRVGIEIANGRAISGARLENLVELFEVEREAGIVDALMLISHGASRGNAWEALQAVGDISYLVLDDDLEGSLLLVVRSLGGFLASEA